MRVTESAVRGGDRARKTIAPRFSIPRAWPNAAMVLLVGGSLAGLVGSTIAWRIAGIAAAALAAFHLGALGSPDPNANHRANVAERALLELGLSFRAPGPVRPAGPEAGKSDAVEPRRVRARPIAREPLRAQREKGPARPGGYGTPGGTITPIRDYPADAGAPIGVEA